MYEQIYEQSKAVINEFLDRVQLAANSIFIVGCSSSEIMGQTIGKGSSMDAAKAVFDGFYPVLQQNGIYLAAQCCEHLNRAVIIESAALPADAETVCVIPQPKAGGSFATTAWTNFKNPVALEEIKAAAGIDIGGTLIGMHLKKVAVPIRLSTLQIGQANILCAYTRPKYIGGSRAVYTIA